MQIQLSNSPSLFRMNLTVFVVLLHLAVIDWRVGLLPLAAIAVHQLGYIESFRRHGIRWALKRQGLRLWHSWSEEYVSLSYLDGIVLYLSGTILNIALALAAIFLDLVLHPTHTYLLEFANLNALLAVINLIPIGAFKLGQYLQAVLPIAANIKVIKRAEIVFSCILILLAAVQTNSNITINLGIVLLWVNVHNIFGRLQLTQLESAEILDHPSLKQLVAVCVLPAILLLAGLSILYTTPFFVTSEFLVQLGVIGTLIVPQLGWVAEALGMAVFVLLISMLVHEFGHWMIAKRYDYPINRIVIGHPGSTTNPHRCLFSCQFFGTRVEFYSRLYLAGVDIDINSSPKMFTDSLVRTLVFSFSGVAMNLLLAGVGVVIASLWPELSSSLIVINLAMVMVNIMPLPGLDGGWPLIRFTIWLRTRLYERRETLSEADRKSLAYDTFGSIYGKVGTKIPHLLMLLSWLYLYGQITGVI